MDKNNSKIFLVLALMFFVLTIGRFVPGQDHQGDDGAEEKSEQYVETENGEKIVLTLEDLELAEELSEHLNEEGIPVFCTLDMDPVLQLPELPTGCEVTSLTMVLNYFGYPVGKCELADNFLKRSPAGRGTPYESFWGDPYSWRGFGCFAPVIVQCANDYFESAGVENMLAFDYSGREFEDLFAEIYKGNPVIMWSSINLAEPYVNSTWKINGETFEWKAPEHCVVLTGYDLRTGIVKVEDPLKGDQLYAAYLFKDRYVKMGMQAVVVHAMDER